jgi:hypothetical protein
MEINYWPYILEQGCCCLAIFPFFVLIVRWLLSRNKPRINVKDVAESFGENELALVKTIPTMDRLTYILKCSHYTVEFLSFPGLPIEYIFIKSVTVRGRLVLAYTDGMIVKHNSVPISRISKSYLYLKAYHEIYILLNNQIVKIKSV